MTTIPIMQQALSLALSLSPQERLSLIEQVVASVAQEIDPNLMTFSPKTGAELVAMLEAFDPVEFVDPELDDSVEWVAAQRQKETTRLNSYWAGEA